MNRNETLQPRPLRRDTKYLGEPQTGLALTRGRARQQAEGKEVGFLPEKE
jgi:hypothetical protein